MKTRFFAVLVLFILVFTSCSKNDDAQGPNPPVPEGMYFPPIDGTDWETVTVSELQWNEENVQDLYDFLDTKKTKGFMVLKDGRIVMEEYFNGHNQNTKWTWYSAAKSLTATFVGIAQEEGYIDIDNMTSDYLGQDWSNLNSEKQDLITVKNHLSMSTGLTSDINNPVAWICTLPTCLNYTSDAGTRWAYHQGAFMLLQEIITQNTGMTFQEYCKEKIADEIGMDGSWTNQFGLNVYNTNTRGMARFGLLSLNKGTWDGNSVVSESYFNEMITPSQDLNKSYGYLWWLNGKESHMGTVTQDVIQSPLIPNAPNDLFAALGAQDQKIYVVPSQSLVIVRTGDSAGDENALGLSSFDNELWAKINAVID